MLYKNLGHIIRPISVLYKNLGHIIDQISVLYKNLGHIINQISVPFLAISEIFGEEWKYFRYEIGYLMGIFVPYICIDATGSIRQQFFVDRLIIV